MKNNRRISGPLLLLALTLCGGCEFAGLVANTVSPESKPLKVRSEYAGLQNQRVAVLVDANPSLFFEQPLAQREVCEALCLKLAAHVPGIQVVDPKQTVEFQQRNLYWNTVPFAELAQRLGVTRLVIVELTDYQLHEPGNVNIWRGLLAASVSVAETDSPTPNNLVYDSLVSVAYPPNKPLGVLNSDQRTIRLGTLDLFSHQVAGRFYEHEEAPPAEK